MGNGGVSVGERRRGRATLSRLSGLAWHGLRLLSMLALGSVLVIAALGKFARPKAFLGSVIDYRLLPKWMSYAVAVTFPGIELVTGAVLLAGLVAGWEPRRHPGATSTRIEPYVEAAAWITGAMLIVFMAGMSVDILRGMKLDCGCFDLVGSYVPFLKSKHVSWDTVGRDLVLLLMVAPILIRRRPEPGA